MKPSAADIRAALKQRYPHPGYGVVFEVAQSTGFSAHRHLDAVVMGLWPSRGLTLHGIEIKRSRQDFRREVKEPSKAEEIARYCDFFSIAAPEGVVPVEEVPYKWGLLELSSEGLIETKAAEQHRAKAVGREFLAAIFRAATRTVDPETLEALLEKRRSELDAEWNQRFDAAVRDKVVRANEEGEKWKELLKRLGVEDDWEVDAKLIPAIAAVYKAGLTNSYNGLRNLEQTLKEAVERLGPVIEEFQLPERDLSAGLHRHIRRNPRVRRR